MNSDYGYVAPHIKLSEKLAADGVKVWLYDFTYRSKNSVHPEWMGVPHAEELYYLFGSPFFGNTTCPGPNNTACPTTWGNYQHWSQTDRGVSKTTMAVWAAFSKQSLHSDAIQLSHPALRWRRFTARGVMLNITDTTYSTRLVKTKGIEFWGSLNYLNLSSSIPNPCLTSIVG